MPDWCHLLVSPSKQPTLRTKRSRVVMCAPDVVPIGWFALFQPDEVCTVVEAAELTAVARVADARERFRIRVPRLLALCGADAGTHFAAFAAILDELDPDHYLRIATDGLIVPLRPHEHGLLQLMVAAVEHDNALVWDKIVGPVARVRRGADADKIAGPVARVRRDDDADKIAAPVARVRRDDDAAVGGMPRIEFDSDEVKANVLVGMPSDHRDHWPVELGALPATFALRPPQPRSSPPVRRYSRSARYAHGELIQHEIHGAGIVVSTIETTRLPLLVEILFPTTPKSPFGFVTLPHADTPTASFVPAYSAMARYTLGQPLVHTAFGHGVVTSVQRNCVRVRFSCGEKTLVHGRTLTNTSEQPRG